MGKRITNGWAIAKQSWSIIWVEKSLLPFPLFSAVACLLVLASFLAPLFLFPDLLSWAQTAFDNKNGHQPDPSARLIAAAVMFAFYFLNYFVIVFFNTALAACAVTRFRGEDATVVGGLRLACKRLPQIIGWALLAATVGAILRAISERSQWLGKIVIGLIGAAWTIATYFVVPTLAVEGLGPIDSLKRSAKLISEVWGEGLVGNIGLGLIGFLLILPAFAFMIVSVALFSTNQTLLIASIAMCLLYLVAVVVVTSAMKQVFIVGLYLYAAENKAPAGFSADTLAGAFRKK